MAEEETTTEETGAEETGAVDFSSVLPESYKDEDGSWKVDQFKTDYEDLLSFKTHAEEAKAELPKEPGEYEFAISEDHKWPEGFDPAAIKITDAEGNQVEFDPSKVIDKDDPDIPQLQQILHEIGAPKDAMSKIAALFVNREVRSIMDMEKAASEEKKALGPNADARISTVTRALKGAVSESQARALLDGITSADALRGFEALIEKKGINPGAQSAPGGKDYASMSPSERILAGLQERSNRAG